MKDIQILTAILVFVWTSLSTSFDAHQLINEKRDSIILGKVAGQAIDLEHRELIWKGDWQPMMHGVIIRSFIFCILIGAMPFLIEKHRRSRAMITVIFAALAIPLMTLSGSIKSYLEENRLIENSLIESVEEN